MNWVGGGSLAFASFASFSLVHSLFNVNDMAHLGTLKIKQNIYELKQVKLDVSFDFVGLNTHESDPENVMCRLCHVIKSKWLLAITFDNGFSVRRKIRVLWNSLISLHENHKPDTTISIPWEKQKATNHMAIYSKYLCRAPCLML